MDNPFNSSSPKLSTQEAWVDFNILIIIISLAYDNINFIMNLNICNKDIYIYIYIYIYRERERERESMVNIYVKWNKKRMINYFKII